MKIKKIYWKVRFYFFKWVFGYRGHLTIKSNRIINYLLKNNWVELPYKEKFDGKRYGSPADIFMTYTSKWDSMSLMIDDGYCMSDEYTLQIRDLDKDCNQSFRVVIFEGGIRNVNDLKVILWSLGYDMENLKEEEENDRLDG